MEVSFSIMPSPWLVRCVLLAAFTLVAVINWPGGAKQSDALDYGPIAIMPSISTAGGPLIDFGLHFDEPSYVAWGAYDYSAPRDTDVYLRAQAQGDQYYPARYYYYPNNSCTVFAELQLYISHVGQWVPQIGYEIHLLHVKNPQQGHTQIVSTRGNWLYKVIGQVTETNECSPYAPHSHLSGNLLGKYRLHPKADDTCWTDRADGSGWSQCSDTMNWFKKKHKTCTSWDGWTQGRSGNYAEYFCETWSLQTRTDQVPAFTT